MFQEIQCRYFYLCCLSTPINSIKDPSKSEICQTNLFYLYILYNNKYLKTGRRKISLNILLDLSVVNSFIYLFTRQISWLCSEERWLTRLYFDTGLRFCIFGKHKNFTVTLSSVHCCRQWVLGFSILPITQKFFKYEKLECWSLKS